MPQALPVSSLVTITDVLTYPVSADVSVAFPLQQLIFQNRGDDTVYISFDGTNDHLELLSGESINVAPNSASDSYDVRKSGIPTPSAAWWRYQKVWCKTATAATASSVRVTVLP